MVNTGQAVGATKPAQRQPENVKWSVMAVDLSELAEFPIAAHQFNENKKYREAFCTVFQGLETPFKEVDYLQAWYKNLSDAFDSHRCQQRAVCFMHFKLSPSEL